MKNNNQRKKVIRTVIGLLICITMVALPWNIAAQDSKSNISGVVVDDRGETIVGATVVALGTNFATMTDGDGKFTLRVAPGVDLKVSSIGYISKTIQSTSGLIRIVLKEESHQLNEVVAIGYGTVKRANMLGAVSSLSAQEIEDIPAGNLSQTLVGKLASVHVSETTGRPGSTTPLTIRSSGSFSTNAATPIFVINGIIRDQDYFDMLDPNEVESFSILKDGAAAVYGARGAGGAVVVTLKKGKEGKAKISYSGQFGATTPTSFPTMLSAYEQAVLVNESMRYDHAGIKRDVTSNTNSYTLDELEAFKSMDYNWLDAAWNNSYQMRHNLNIGGGTDKVRYFANGSMWTESGTFDKIDVKKYSLRMSLEADVTKDVTASMELSISNNLDKFPYMVGDNEENMNGFYKMLLNTPRWLPYQDGDRYLTNSINSNHNPLGLLNSESYKSSESRNSQVNASLLYKPEWLQGLTASVRLGYTLGNSYSKQYVSPYEIWDYGTTGLHGHIINLEDPIEYSIANASNERLTLDYGQSNNYQLNAGLNYQKTIGDHSISAMVNYEQSESFGNGSSIRAINQQIPGLERLEAFEGIDIYSSSLNNSGRLGFIGRLNYDYKQKYILEASFREEASVKFDKGHRWGFFPFVAVGWRISEEDFYKEYMEVVNYMKIRASAGVLGQDNGIGSYEYKWSYNLGSAAYFGTGTETGMVNGLVVKNNGIVTSGVTWEKTQSLNLGVDTKWFDNKIDFVVDGYFRHTWDIFDKVSVTFTDLVGTEGSGIPKINNGIVNSWGIDVELGYNGTIDENTNYYIKGNLSWGDNIVIKKEQDPKWKNTYIWEEGKSTNRGEEGFLTSGIFRTQEQVDAYMAEHPGMVYSDESTTFTPGVGMLIFEDIARAGNQALGEPYFVYEPDGIVDKYDKVPLFEKSGTPFAMGLSLGASYKTFRLDMTFTGGFGGYEIMNKDERIGPSATTNVPNYWRDCWTEDNPNGAYPNPSYNALNVLPSSHWVRNSAIFRLRTINMSYNMPRELSSKLGIPNIRLFLTGTNILTLWSDYDYKDPNLARYYDYPLLRSFNFGVNLTL